MKNDEYFMKQALKEAFKAILIDEVPVGAVIVKDDKIIAKGYNKKETKKLSTSHAEIEAINKACKKLGAWRLTGCTMYVTLEPCSMCAGAMIQSRIDKVVFGTKDPKGGAVVSSFNLFEQNNLNHHVDNTYGILEEDCSLILKNYFRKKRLSKNTISNEK